MLEKILQREMGRRAFEPLISRMLLLVSFQLCRKLNFRVCEKRSESKVMRMQK